MKHVELNIKYELNKITLPKVLDAEIYFNAVVLRDMEKLKYLFYQSYPNDKLITELIYSAIHLNKPCNKIIIFLINKLHNLRLLHEQIVYELFKVKNIEKSVFNTTKIFDYKASDVIIGILLADNLQAFKRIPWHKYRGDVLLYSSIPAFAAHEKSARILAYLLKKEESVKRYNHASIYLAIRNGKLGILKNLISFGAKLYPFEKFYLDHAYQHGRAEILCYLIEDIQVNLKNLPKSIFTFYIESIYFRSISSDSRDTSFITFVRREFILQEDVEAINKIYQCALRRLSSIQDDLYYALCFNKTVLAINLLNKMSSDEINNLLIRCVLTNKFQGAIFLLQFDSNIQLDKSKAMDLACRSRNIEALNFIVQYGILSQPEGR